MTEDLSKSPNIPSRFDAPGCYAYIADSVVVPPDELYFEPWISNLQAITDRLTSSLHINGKLNSEEMSWLSSVWNVARMGRDANPGTYPGNLYTSGIQLDALRYLYKSTSTAILTTAALLSFPDHEKLLFASGPSWQQSIIWDVFLAVARAKWNDENVLKQRSDEPRTPTRPKEKRDLVFKELKLRGLSAKQIAIKWNSENNDNVTADAVAKALQRLNLDN